MALAKHDTSVDTCDVAGCDKPVERSINMKQAARCSLSFKSPDLRSVHLCKEHYKEYKKQTKQDRSLDQLYRWRYFSSGRPPASRQNAIPRPRSS